jgi:hypothetical protein
MVIGIGAGKELWDKRIIQYNKIFYRVGGLAAGG